MALVSKKNLLEEYEEEQKKSTAKQKTTSAVNKTNKAAQEAAARKEADLIGAKDAGKISSKKSTLPSQRSTKQGASDFVANAYKTAQKSEYKTEKKDKTVTTAEINKKQQEAKKAVQEKKSVVGNLINAGSLEQKVKTDNNITLQNREDFKAKQQAEAAGKAKAIIQNIIDNARNDAIIKQTVTPENREKVREQKREEVWETKEDDGAAALALKGLGNRFRTVPGTLIESGAEAFYDMTGDTVKGYSEGDKITLENRNAAKTAKIADNSAWFLNPAREKAKEVAETRQAGGIYDMATEQLDSLRAMTDNELVQDLITAADGGATMLGYMALPFGTKYLSAYMAAGQVLDTYNSRREMGESKEEAAVRGITDGAIAAAVESLGGVGKIPGLNKAADVIEAAAGKNFLTNLVMQALSEGGEGFAEYVLGYVGNVMNDLAFKGEIQTEFDINEAIENAWIEGLAGGMFGAGSFGIRKISGDPNTNATIGEVSSDIIAAVKSVFNMENEINKTEIPQPFEGTEILSEEQQLVADKIMEIENRPVSDADKAAMMEEVAKAVVETTGNADVVAEAERFRTIHEEKAKNEYTKEYGISEDDLGEYLSAGGRTNKNKLQALKDGKDIILTTKKQVSDYIKKAISGAKDIVTVAYGKVTNRLAKDVLNYSGGRIDVEGSYLEFVPYDIKHAYEQHLNAKEAGNINLTIEDFEKIPEYLNNYDDIVYAIKFGNGNTRVCVSKKLPNGRVLLIETVSKSRGSMQFKNMIGITEERYIKDYEEVYKKRNISNSREGESPTIPLRDDYASNIIIPPVSGISNTSSIGNTVFGPEIFRKQEDAFEEGRAESISAEGTKTPSMERAAPNLDVQYWTGIAEGIDMESGIWRMKDFARVLDGAAGENKELRQRLYDLYEKPLNEAQGTYAKNYADKVESITEKFKELGIKAGSKESAAVQRIGEGVKEIDKNGNTTEYTLDDLKKEFPDSWENIKAGADYCRKVYDEFLNDLNAMYSEIYPATVEKANEQVSEYNARISLTADHIASYENVILELEKSKREKQQQLSKKKPDSLIYAELENQIANIDRKIDIATRRIEILKNRKLTKEISRDTLLAQIENGEILKNKQIKPRKDYFRHFQELTDEFAEIADIFSNDQRIPPNLAGKSADTKPRTIWTSIAQSRGKNYYTEDAVGGLLRYTEIAEKLLVYDPLISHFRDVNSAIRAAGVMVDNEVKGKGTNAGQFAAWADDITNQLAGKTNKIDRIVSDNFGALGRSGIKAIEALNRRVKSNAILGNVRSALVQIGNLPNASLYIQNPKDWANGVISMLNDNVKNDPLIQEGRNRSKFMNRRYMGDTIDELTKEIQQNKILDKPKEFALWMLGAGDKLSAELIWHTAYTRALRNPDVLSAESNKLRSYEDAVDYADDITRRSIGGRAEGDIPYFEESKITGLIAPFQIEVANTFNAFAEQGKKKNIAGLLAFEINVFLLNCVLEGITGDRPLGLDFIKVAWDIFNEATGDDEEEEEKEAWDIVTYGLGRILGETLSSMPFGTQIAGFLTGGDEQKAEKWFGDSDPTRYGTGNIGMGALADAADYFIEGETPEEFYRLATEGGTVGEWAEPVLETVDTFAPLAMPWGGKQLSRSLRGVQQIAEGGAYGTDDDGKEYMKFPQVYDVDSVIKTLLFGQYASDAGQRYIDSGFKDKLSAKQTEQMKLAENFGVPKEEFYDVMLGLKGIDKKAEKQEALFDMDISERTKNVIDGILFGKTTYKTEVPAATRNYSDPEAFYESGLDKDEFALHEMGYSEKEIEKITKALKESGKKAQGIENLADALDIEEAEAFEVYQKIKGEWINDESDLDEEDFARAEGARTLYGMSTDNYITVLNYSKYGAQIKNEDGETEYSTKAEYVIPHIMEATGWNKELATEMYNRVHKYDYTRADLEEEQAKQLDTSAEWYGVEDKGYFTARNIIKMAEGEKDQYGNTVSGSKKEAAIKAIAEQMKIGTEEATIYYLAAIGAKNGGLALSAEDLSSSHREDLKTAIERGWTERQYLDAVNIIKLSGAAKKDEIIKALTDAGASYSMAQGYYNLRENKDYNKAAYFAYGMKNEKQVTKADYFMEHYGKGNVTAKDVTAWYKAASGCSKKQEYIDAYKSAGATYDQAVKFYNLMRGYDKTFNAWYKENGGT